MIHNLRLIYYSAHIYSCIYIYINDYFWQDTHRVKIMSPKFKRRAAPLSPSLPLPVEIKSSRNKGSKHSTYFPRYDRDMNLRSALITALPRGSSGARYFAKFNGLCVTWQALKFTRRT